MALPTCPGVQSGVSYDRQNRISEFNLKHRPRRPNQVSLLQPAMALLVVAFTVSSCNVFSLEQEGADRNLEGDFESGGFSRTYQVHLPPEHEDKQLPVVIVLHGGGGSGPTEEKRIYEIDPGVTKDVQIVLYEKPRMMTINTLISGNIPSMFSTFLRTPLEINPPNLEEYYVTSDRELTLELPDEFLVDNEDPGFSYVSV